MALSCVRMFLQVYVLHLSVPDEHFKDICTVNSFGRERFPLLFLISFYSILKFLFIYFWLHWVFIAAHGLSLVASSKGYSSLWCVGYSLLWLLLSRSTGSRYAGSVVVVQGLSCSAACGIFPDQGSNPCPLH